MRVKPRNQSVQLISKGEPWSSDHPDPSRSLSPRTLDRLRELLRTPAKAKNLEFTKNTEIRNIEKSERWWTLRDQDGIPFASLTRPILANGFESGLGPVADHFEHDENGLPVFSEKADESTLTSGLFYSGPSLVHRNSLFCFIYKFRARFGVIAHEVATRLGKPDVDEKLMPYLKAGFMNEDLDCCTECQCAIEPAESAPEPSAFAS
jgi:putative flavoprotein involved in K+ transport